MSLYSRLSVLDVIVKQIVVRDDTRSERMGRTHVNSITSNSFTTLHFLAVSDHFKVMYSEYLHLFHLKKVEFSIKVFLEKN